MDIGRVIKKWRLIRGLSQKSLADKLKISTSYLSLLEANKRDLTFMHLVNISKTLHVSLFVLILCAYNEKELYKFPAKLLEILTEEVGNATRFKLKKGEPQNGNQEI